MKEEKDNNKLLDADTDIESAQPTDKEFIHQRIEESRDLNPINTTKIINYIDAARSTINVGVLGISVKNSEDPAASLAGVATTEVLTNLLILIFLAMDVHFKKKDNRVYQMLRRLDNFDLHRMERNNQKKKKARKISKLNVQSLIKNEDLKSEGQSETDKNKQLTPNNLLPKIASRNMKTSSREELRIEILDEENSRFACMGY